MKSVKAAIQNEKLKPIFTSAEVRAIGIIDENHNLSNYDKKNQGSKNKKVLISREISENIYYAFDEYLR
jgi:hypothetical protein